jgi:hypothetical protein
MVKVRWNRHYAGLCNPSRFSEKRNQNDGRENGALRGDGNNQRSAADSSFTRALLGAAFHEAALQGTKIILRMGLGFDRHHTPPQKSSASESWRFCDAGFLWVAQIPQETGAALAGM